ncbi:MAG: S9 family peptidase [Rubrivivax sp.]|nr:S9 family peptidase [Rubrivivax sp.]
MTLHFSQRLLALLGFVGLMTMTLPHTHAQTAPAAAPADPHLWLEDVEGDKALTWVRERNGGTRKVLEAWPAFGDTRTRVREILDSRDRIPAVTRSGNWLYNLWQDPANPRGLWRRTTLDEYRKPQPQWQPLLDVDALGKAEGVNWVFSGAECLGAGDGPCLVSLSRGGADATVVREFDLATRRFVPGGFTLPEAKSSTAWIDRNTLYVGTDFGPGSMTESGYPRVIKRWTRGTPLSAAETVFEAEAKDVGIGVGVDHTPGHEMSHFIRYVDFYRNEHRVIDGLGRGPAQKLDKPIDASVSFWYGRALVRLRSDWVHEGRTWPKGSLLVTDGALLRQGKPQLTALFTPTATRSLESYITTRGTVVVSVMDNVAGRLQEWRPVREDGQTKWISREVQAPFPGNISVQSWHDPLVADDPLAERYALSYTDFLTPDTLFLAQTGSDTRERLKTRPSFFDATGMRAEQRFATSRDGTRVPYFVVWPRGAQADGRNPTLLYGYGGFQVSMQPWYSGVFGSQWYARGGVLVVANIRGGGEYGPAWHQAALKADKQKSYDDFAAVAEDLIKARVTNPRQLGIMGGSNGGLLVGAVMLQRPELFGAVVCQVPLLDMRRYHQLLAGASWMAEYGDPDKPEEWAWISRYSPYQNVRAGVKLPPVFFITSTRDDRVHPGHARKMAARMIEQGHDVSYYENIEGGHGGAADNAQLADMKALEFAFLWQRLGGRQQVPATPSREASR